MQAPPSRGKRLSGAGNGIGQVVTRFGWNFAKGFKSTVSGHPGQ
ncbi:MAG: hypothetical protein AVDCRST_MAG27-3430 [uncultured Craurococcus sp.]|uniref:Uncharacterized protein n=1 Tax=uncultured Craurococcus sp. TaxID=1135998 RepID=A0A6J4JC48_9PROT|nr:MAG: hypothetical protein AVDCRST_MAG27-3430 [uncultured Craurococcus sp.]